MKFRFPIGLALFAGGLVSLSGCSVFHSSVTTEYKEAVKAGPYDALIVPGFPATDGQWNRVLMARVYWAKYLYDSGVVDRIIFSGAATRSPYNEGKLMALYAEALGVPGNAILTEEEALHTCENLYFSYRLTRDLGLAKVAVTSDPIQTFTLKRFAREYEIPVAFLTADLWELLWMDKEDVEIDPGPALDPAYVPITEKFTPEEIKQNSDGARVKAMMGAEH